MTFESGPVAPLSPTEVAPAPDVTPVAEVAEVPQFETPQVDAPQAPEGSVAEQNIAETQGGDTLAESSERAQAMVALKEKALSELSAAAAQGDWPQDRVDAVAAQIENTYR